MACFRCADRPQWRTVSGGAAPLHRRNAAHASFCRPAEVPCARLIRVATKVVVEAGGAAGERFDHAIVATHADQALAMLDEANSAEANLGGV